MRILRPLLRLVCMLSVLSCLSCDSGSGKQPSAMPETELRTMAKDKYMLTLPDKILAIEAAEVREWEWLSLAVKLTVDKDAALKWASAQSLHEVPPGDARQVTSALIPKSEWWQPDSLPNVRAGSVTAAKSGGGMRNVKILVGVDSQGRAIIYLVFGTD